MKVIKKIEEGLKNSMSYPEYRKLIKDLLEKNQSTTKDAGEAYVEYSILGYRRMLRWEKRFKLDSAQEEAIKEFDQNLIWLVISEGWCGDAAHALPIINKLAEANEKINLRIVLREENLELMDAFLTNGGRSIPKLIAFDPEKKMVMGTWGPRPEPAQKIFLEAKEKEIAFDIYEKDLQMWYNKDKGQTISEEVLQMLNIEISEEKTV